MISSFGETLTTLIDLACAEIVWSDDLIYICWLESWHRGHNFKVLSSDTVAIVLLYFRNDIHKISALCPW